MAGRLRAPAVILTSGTFLRGMIHIGDERRPAGRVGARLRSAWPNASAEIAPATGRLKTGTPARLDGRTIDWSAVEMQPGDAEPVMFSFLNRRPEAPQIACGITHTTPRTHEIITANLERSAMFSGHIRGVGPRYCPSVEDKVARLPTSLAPDLPGTGGAGRHTVYPNGISTSLPREMQEAFIRTIPGLESSDPPARLCDRIRLRRSAGAAPDARVRDLEGLFLAGQINGTTGYEEAAAQGLVAGLNAAGRALSARQMCCSRATDSYIGVMVDDLTSRGVTEPYRMFTSRAEYRLSLRIDNADQRLTMKAIALACVSEVRRAAFEDKSERLGRARALLADATVSSRELQRGRGERAGGWRLGGA
jgi:tRNA uridine 5-carboxymethylaminomethyl modification enzyme